MPRLNWIMRVGSITAGLAAMVWGFAFWHIVARDNPQLLCQDEIIARIVGFIVIGAALIIGTLFFWGPTPVITPRQVQIQPPAPPHLGR